MKREYTAPEAEIEKFLFSAKQVISTSGFDEEGGEGEIVSGDDW